MLRFPLVALALGTTIFAAGARAQDCAVPLTLDLQSGERSRTYSGAASFASQQSGGCSSGVTEENVISFSVATDQLADFEALEGSSMYLTEGCPGFELRCVAHDGFSMFMESVLLRAGVPYFMIIEDDSSPGSGSLDVTLRDPADTCGSAFAVSAPTPSSPELVFVDLFDAGAQLESTCGGEGREQAVFFTPSAAGPITASTSHPFASLSIREGSCGGPELACGNPATFEAQAGVQYFLIADSETLGLSDFEVELVAGGAPPVNDACEAAIPTALPAPGASRALIAQVGGESQLRGDCGGDGAEAVFELNPTRATSLAVETGGDASFDTVAYLREAACDDAALELACNDDDASVTNFGSRIQADLIAGRTYYLVVDAFSANEGAADVRLIDLSGEGEGEGEPVEPGEGEGEGPVNPGEGEGEGPVNPGEGEGEGEAPDRRDPAENEAPTGLLCACARAASTPPAGLALLALAAIPLRRRQSR